jgi:hypothetical protein
MPEKPKPENEGEGSKSADRAYREDLKEFLEQHDPEELARSAARELDADQESYRQAEQEGKKHIAEEDYEVTRGRKR